MKCNHNKDEYNVFITLPFIQMYIQQHCMVEKPGQILELKETIMKEIKKASDIFYQQ